MQPEIPPRLGVAAHLVQEHSPIEDYPQLPAQLGGGFEIHQGQCALTVVRIGDGTLVVENGIRGRGSDLGAQAGNPCLETRVGLGRQRPKEPRRRHQPYSDEGNP